MCTFANVSIFAYALQFFVAYNHRTLIFCSVLTTYNTNKSVVIACSVDTTSHTDMTVQNILLGKCIPGTFEIVYLEPSSKYHRNPYLHR